MSKMSSRVSVLIAEKKQVFGLHLHSHFTRITPYTCRDVGRQSEKTALEPMVVKIFRRDTAGP
jgi:hypothetical protein